MKISLYVPHFTNYLHTSLPFKNNPSLDQGLIQYVLAQENNYLVLWFPLNLDGNTLLEIAM